MSSAGLSAGAPRTGPVSFVIVSFPSEVANAGLPVSDTLPAREAKDVDDPAKAPNPPLPFEAPEKAVFPPPTAGFVSTAYLLGV